MALSPSTSSLWCSLKMILENDMFMHLYFSIIFHAYTIPPLTFQRLLIHQLRSNTPYLEKIGAIILDLAHLRVKYLYQNREVLMQLMIRKTFNNSH